MLKKVTNFFKKNIFESISVTVLLLIGAIIRFYRINLLLGFYYDQGRDAQVIWDLIHSHKFFLIGPTTGIAGIFRGPFYYYLIVPFYWLGRGNPIWPEVFLIATSIVALGLMYYLTRKIGGTIAAIITLILGCFSFEIIYASRWLSNPTPMLLLSMVVVWMIFLIREGKRWAWIVIFFILGLSLFSFGSSGELFYLPAVAIFAIWHFFSSKKALKNIPSRKIIISSIAAFLFSYLPLFAFDIKHGGLLTKNIQNFIFGEKSFGTTGAQFIFDRFAQIISYFSVLLFHQQYAKEWLWLIALAIVIIYVLSALFKNEKFRIIFLLLICPLLGLLFFQGNFGNIYGYYLTGYFLIFLIFVGTALGYVFEKSVWGKIFVTAFLFVFITNNWFWTRGMINTNIDDPTIIVLGNEKQAIDWIYTNAGNRKFNVDVYVPPVIPYSYDYLFTWIANPNKVDAQVSLLYTLYEIDPDHKDRLQAWLDRQKGIGKIIKEEKFGGITVQERQRILYTK